MSRGSRKLPKLTRQFSQPKAAASYAAGLLGAWKEKSRGNAPLVVVFDIDDTLLSENRKQDAFFLIPQIRWLIGKTRELGGSVHLITARNDDPNTRKYTVEQLKMIDILPGRDYDSLHLTPGNMRDTMATVSQAKQALRRKVGREQGGRVILSVGDQWTDHVRVASDKDIETLDETFPASFTIVRVDDDSTLWGLKLPYL